MAPPMLPHSSDRVTRRRDTVRVVDRGRQQGGAIVEWKLELVVVPVSDVDRAKAFYVDQAGFNLDVDHRAGEDFRVVQLTPPGSACSITVMNPRGEPAPPVQGLHLVVVDIEAARAELIGRGVAASE